LIASGFVWALVGAGCGGDEEPTTSSSTTSSTTSTSADDVDANGFPPLAYIEPRIGAVPDGVRPDGREGALPDPVELGDLERAADAAGCELRLDLKDEGNTHLSDPDVPNVNYKTSPPTSGDHYAGNEAGAGALADGAYLDYPPLGRSVHALEHGRVAIQYSPDLSEEEQLEIKGVFDLDPAGVLLFPNPEMPYDVAITGWTRLAGCDSYEGTATLDVLRDFRDTYRGRGPEDFPIEL
jgi:hypothetical protein